MFKTKSIELLYLVKSLVYTVIKGVLRMKIRALEETDLQFVHHLNNEYTIMSYWFEEPYESLSELKTLYQKHILDESERRFIIEDDHTSIGVVELVKLTLYIEIVKFKLL